MKQEEKRIAIAEACGWTGIRGETGYPSDAAKLADNYYTIPDYFNDLNAMHEAEKALNAEQESSYWEFLLAAHEYIQPWAGCATASQRAQAFLRTLNLWKD